MFYFRYERLAGDDLRHARFSLGASPGRREERGGSKTHNEDISRMQEKMGYSSGSNKSHEASCHGFSTWE